MLGVIGIDGTISEKFYFRPMFTEFVKSIQEIFKNN
jgi:hypothetical protein